jgi:uncharacterized membrane protein YgcG
VAIEMIRSNHVHLHSQFADYHALDQFPCEEFPGFFEAFPVRQNGASAGKIDHIWFTLVTLSVLKSKPQVHCFIQLSNEMKHQANVIVAIHGETWLFQLRAWERAVYNHAILTAAQRAIAQANSGGVAGGNGGGIAGGNGGVVRGTGGGKTRWK